MIGKARFDWFMVVELTAGMGSTRHGQGLRS
jgi:hypothetical protein